MKKRGQRTIRKWFSDPVLLGWVVVVFFVFPPLAHTQAERVEVELSTGIIEGALYTIAVPPEWSGDLLLVAHGLRQANTPLNARLNPNQPFYTQLLGSGWMLAITSYRRNGIIVSEAVDDLDNLLSHIESTFGKPNRTLIMGSSMGGAIVTLIAETRSENYDGVLAIGAALTIKDSGIPFRLNYNPLIPILFLSNQSEIQTPLDYLELAMDARVVPAVWKVSRDGHVNVNDAERTAALEALNRFIDEGEIERDKDGTISSQLASTSRFSDEQAINRITGVSQTYGNIFSGYVAADLQQLGIMIGSWFHMTLGGQTVTVKWGTRYRDVGRGEWVAFITGDDNLMISRNTDNACASVNCKTGDPLILFR